MNLDGAFENVEKIFGTVSTDNRNEIARALLDIVNLTQAGKPVRVLVADQSQIGTSAARWRDKGEPDPHGDRYDKERANLALGRLTDDELANAVFLCNHGKFDLAAIQRGEPSSIALLTAAKDRIRWLSRKLAQQLAAESDSNTRQRQDAAEYTRTFGLPPPRGPAVVD